MRARDEAQHVKWLVGQVLLGVPAAPNASVCLVEGNRTNGHSLAACTNLRVGYCPPAARGRLS